MAGLLVAARHATRRGLVFGATPAFSDAASTTSGSAAATAAAFMVLPSNLLVSSSSIERTTTRQLRRRLSTLPRHRSSSGSSGEVSNFPGASSAFVHQLKVNSTHELTPNPCFRVMGPDGIVIEGADMPDVSDDTAVSWYREMVQVSVMDNLLDMAQRQARVSFYMKSAGEEATHIGSAAALDSEDVILAQYREIGVLLHRGFGLQQVMHQCFSNDLDYGKGRQMPIHYGSREHNFHTISSPLATQLPQAAGVAYALKRKGQGNVAVCYFGEGAASEGDAHPAFNFSATLECPIVFFCRNNGYAISTPTREQYRGDGIVSRAPGYGMDWVRVDGNDIFAVYAATCAARESAVANNRPVLIEAMTYRMGHHSTSDDSSSYRGKDELNVFSADTPIQRMRAYLESKGLWDQEQEEELISSHKKVVKEAFAAADERPKPPLSDLFEDVYAEVPPHLEKQQEELKAHVAKYPNEYPTGGHVQ